MTIRPVATSSRLDSGWIIFSDRLQKNDWKHVGLDVSMFLFCGGQAKDQLARLCRHHSRGPCPW